MKTALSVLAAVLLVPFVLGLVAGMTLTWWLPILNRWLSDHAARQLAKKQAVVRDGWPPIPGPLPPAPPLRKGSGDRPTTPRPAFPAPKPSLDPRFYRGKPS